MSLKKVREIRIFQESGYLSLDFMNQAGHLVRKSDIVAFGLEMKIGPVKPGDYSSVSVRDIPIEKGMELSFARTGAFRRKRGGGEAAQGQRRAGEVGARGGDNDHGSDPRGATMSAVAEVLALFIRPSGADLHIPNSG